MNRKTRIFSQKKPTGRELRRKEKEKEKKRDMNEDWKCKNVHVMIAIVSSDVIQQDAGTQQNFYFSHTRTNTKSAFIKSQDLGLE